MLVNVDVVVSRSGGSGRDRRRGEAEFGPIDPHTMQDHGELAGERDLGALQTSPLRQFHRPGFQARPLRGSGQHDVRGFKEGDAHGWITGPTDGAHAIGFPD